MSKRIFLGISAASLVAAASTAHAQVARQVPGNINESTGGGYGSVVLDVSDFDGDGENEYAVAAPFESILGLNFGRVLVFDGASGADIIDVSGTASGDEFGTSMCTIPDLDQDQIPEIVVGTPGRSGPMAAPGPDWGGFRVILSGNPNATLQLEATDGNRLGLGAAALDDDTSGPSPIHTFAVSSKSHVEIWQYGPVTLSLTSSIAIPGIAGDSLCSAGTIGGVPAFAVNGSNDEVFVIDINGMHHSTIQGPSGSSYGASMDLLRDPGLDDILIIGAAGANGGDGQVDLADPASGLILQSPIGVPGSGFGFGSAVATGGDVDGDGLNDFVTLDQNGTEIEVYGRNGGRTGNPIAIVGGFGPVIGTALDITSVAGAGPQDGFADVLLGSRTTQVSPTLGFNEAQVYFGGPDSNLLNVSSWCTPAGPLGPVLAISSPGVVGTSGQLTIAGATNGIGFLAAGAYNPAGAPLPGGCLLHVVPATVLNIPIVGGSFQFPPPPIAFTVGSLGTEIAFQSANFFSLGPPATFETTNTLVVTVGW